MEFKDILAEYLLLKSMTQTQLAKTIGVKQSQVSEWLKGKAKPGYDILKSFVLNLDKDAEYWLGISP